jgi:hypothetical protein
LLVVAVLLVLPLFGSDSPKEYDDKTENVGIEGKWRLIDGKNVVTFRSGTYTVDDGDGNPWRGTYRTDKSHYPHHLDLFPSNGPYKGKRSNIFTR